MIKIDMGSIQKLIDDYEADKEIDLNGFKGLVATESCKGKKDETV